MFIRPINVKKAGKNHKYWALVESYRAERGPRQRVVAYLGKLPRKVRRGVKRKAEGHGPSGQTRLFDRPEPHWVEVDTSRVRVERCRDYGGPWLGLKLARKLGLPGFLRRTLPRGREDIPWAEMALVLVLCRLTDPCSELKTAEHSYPRSAMPELLGIPSEKVNDDRLYRALDALLPHKEKLQKFLRRRMGRLFDLKFDFLLYDITSTYFEGQADHNDLAKRGYSRDGRPDCKQVCLGLVVAEGGMPVGYEIFPGNTSDGATLQAIVQQMEGRYGLARRVWVLDRGMISEENLEFLRRGSRRSYIVGTPRSALKSFERELLEGGWEEVRSGVEVKLCPGPDGEETFILCCSSGRRQKEKAIHERFEKRIEKRLRKMQAYCEKRNYRPEVIGERIGRLKQKYSRAAGLFDIEIVEKPTGGVRLLWQKNETRREFSELSEGCYLLRSNIPQWSASALWDAYVQLTEAEAAFRIHKTDLRIRPIWHQKESRVRAHILVCFLAYVLWKTLAALCERSGLGNEPRRVFEELCRIKLVDVVLPTRAGVDIRKRCVTRPDEGQQILLEQLGMELPESIDLQKM